MQQSEQFGHASSEFPTGVVVQYVTSIDPIVQSERFRILSPFQGSLKQGQHPNYHRRGLTKQLSRARDQISQLVEQFPSDFREGASLNSSVAEQQTRNKKMQGLRKFIAPR